MREPTYFMLAALLDGPLHGYAIIKRTEEVSGGRVRLATGTLYTALDRLTAEGYVTLVREEIVNGRNRRSYGLTDSRSHGTPSRGDANGRSRPARHRIRHRGSYRAKGASSMTTLERRYRRMLYAYPYDYRAERGDEILGTLLDGARAGQTRPTLRERRALLFGGLKVRSAQNRLPTRTNVRLAMAFGAALTLALLVTSGVSENIDQTGALVTRTWYCFDWRTALQAFGHRFDYAGPCSTRGLRCVVSAFAGHGHRCAAAIGAARQPRRSDIAFPDLHWRRSGPRDSAGLPDATTGSSVAAQAAGGHEAAGGLLSYGTQRKFVCHPSERYRSFT